MATGKINLEVTTKRIWWRWVIFKLYLFYTQLGFGDKKRAAYLGLNCFDVYVGGKNVGNLNGK